MRYLTAVALLLCGAAAGLDWTNTGELAKAKYVRDLVVGQSGYLYAAANIDTSSVDSGWVFVSSDLVTWERGGDMPGDVDLITSLLYASGDTLFAGTSALYQGYDGPLLYVSWDKAATWQFRSELTGARIGYAITALLENHAGNIIAGHNYMAMHTSGAPCYSTDRGATWTQGPVTGRIADMYCLLADADNNLYCGGWGTGGIVLKSADNGATWAATGELYDAGHTRSLVLGPPGAIFAATYPRTSPQEPIGRVFRTTDGGASWEQLGYGYFNNTSGMSSLCWTGDGLLFAGSAPSAEVFVSEDGGVTWTSAGTVPGANALYKLIEVTKGDSTFIYAATGPNGDVFRAYVPPHAGTGEKKPGARTEVTRFAPNPTRGEIVFSAGRRLGVTIADAAGRRVMRHDVGPTRNRLDLGGLAPGLYFVTVRDGAATRTEPVVLVNH